MIVEHDFKSETIIATVYYLISNTSLKGARIGNGGLFNVLHFKTAYGTLWRHVQMP